MACNDLVYAYAYIRKSISPLTETLNYIYTYREEISGSTYWDDKFPITADWADDPCIANWNAAYATWYIDGLMTTRYNNGISNYTTKPTCEDISSGLETYPLSGINTIGCSAGSSDVISGLRYQFVRFSQTSETDTRVNYRNEVRHVWIAKTTLTSAIATDNITFIHNGDVVAGTEGECFIPGESHNASITFTTTNTYTAGRNYSIQVYEQGLRREDLDFILVAKVGTNTKTVLLTVSPEIDFQSVEFSFIAVGLTTVTIPPVLIYACPDCISATCYQIFGPNEICQDGTNNYTVRQNVEDYCLDDYNYGDKTIYFDYNQSNIVKDIDFTGPKSVYIEPGKNSVNFDVDIHTEYSEGKFLQIDIDEVD